VTAQRNSAEDDALFRAKRETSGRTSFLIAVLVKINTHRAPLLRWKGKSQGRGGAGRLRAVVASFQRLDFAGLIMHD